jgi:hypothetical protein
LAPALHLNPSDDEAFAAAVHRLVASGLWDASACQQELRHAYPGALVRPREQVHEPFVLWYVYRDGHWVPPETGAIS